MGRTIALQVSVDGEATLLLSSVEALMLCRVPDPVRNFLVKLSTGLVGVARADLFKLEIS